MRHAEHIISQNNSQVQHCFSNKLEFQMQLQLIRLANKLHQGYILHIAHIRLNYYIVLSSLLSRLKHTKAVCLYSLSSEK